MQCFVSVGCYVQKHTTEVHYCLDSFCKYVFTAVFNSLYDCGDYESNLMFYTRNVQINMTKLSGKTKIHCNKNYS